MRSFICRALAKWLLGPVGRAARLVRDRDACLVQPTRPPRWDRLGAGQLARANVPLPAADRRSRILGPPRRR